MSTGNSIHIHQAIIEAAKRNDRNAQSKLYSLYYKSIYNSCLRIVSDAFVAEDIMHDAFIDALKHINRLSAEVSFGSWLKKIAINKSINYLKKEQLIADKLEDYSTLNTPEEEQEKEHSINDIKEAMKQLAPNYKVIFSLYMIEGYDHDEISEIMKISSSTSRSQLSRAKKRVKQIIEQTKWQTA